MFAVGHFEILVDGHIEVFYARAVEHVAFRVAEQSSARFLPGRRDSPIGQRLLPSAWTQKTLT